MDHDPSEEKTAVVTCREVAEWASAYLEAQVSAAGHARMTSHMASCAGCRAYVEQIGLVRETLQGLPDPIPTLERRLFLRQRFAGR